MFGRIGEDLLGTGLSQLCQAVVTELLQPLDDGRAHPTQRQQGITFIGWKSCIAAHAQNQSTNDRPTPM